MIDLPTTYRPDSALHPGKLLREELNSRGISQREFARQLDRPPQVVNQIIREKKAITPETALGIERVLGIDAQFWVNLQGVHDLVLARMAEDAKLVQDSGHWLQRIPWKAMAKLNWIEDEWRDTARLRAILQFFGVPSFKALDALPPVTEAVDFRITPRTTVDEWALRAWLRQGQHLAEREEAQPFDRARFARAAREIRGLTRSTPEEFWLCMKRLSIEAGVVVVVIPHLPKSGANGATRWLDDGRPLIQLSILRKQADIFWFSFFHEAAHVLRGDRDVVYIDIDGAPREDEAEQAADRFAADMLIPPQRWAAFTSIGRFDKRSITQFADAEEIHPGIVVGRLQKEQLLRYDQHNDLRMTLSDAVFVD